MQYWEINCEHLEAYLQVNVINVKLEASLVFGSIFHWCTLFFLYGWCFDALDFKWHLAFGLLVCPVVCLSICLQLYLPPMKLLGVYLLHLGIHVKASSLGFLFLTPSPSWTFISLLEVEISLFLGLISYLSFFSLKRVNCVEFCYDNALLS